MSVGRNGGYELGWGRGRPESTVGGSKAIQKEREAIPFFEEREDKLGAWVTRAQPAQVAAIGGLGGYGVVGYLWGVNECIREGVMSVIRTGLVGREETIFSIDRRRSGYISARRTSRSAGC